MPALAVAAVLGGELRVGGEQHGEVAEEEAVLPLDLEIAGGHGVHRLEGGGFAGGQGVVLRPGRHDAREKLAHDLGLVAEMVVEIAGAHPERLGDVVGGDVGGAALVEQGERRVEDAGLGVGLVLCGWHRDVRN